MEPITIDLNDYEIAGGGKLGDSYIKRDNPDILLKIYPPLREQMGRDEFERAWKVYRMGLPCPERAPRTVGQVCIGVCPDVPQATFHNATIGLIPHRKGAIHSRHN